MKLEEIFIKNFAVIENLQLEFAPRLTVMTGETGAGKSVVLDAIRFLFGESDAPSHYARSQDRPIEVSARLSWEKDEAQSLIKETDLELENNQQEILLRRLYDCKTSRSRAMVDDRPVSVGVLRRLGRAALEMQLQGQSRELEESSFAREFLDEWAGLEDLREEYRQCFDQWQRAVNEFSRHQEFVKEHLGKLELIEHQCREFDQIPRHFEELEALESQLPRLLQQGQVVELLTQARDEMETLQGIVKAKSIAQKLSDFCPDLSSAKTLLEELSQCERSMEMARENLRSLEKLIEIDPGRLEEMLNLRARAQRLMSKYRCQSVQELLILRQRLERERDQLINQEIEQGRLESQIKERHRPMAAKSKELSQKRRQGAMKLSAWVSREIASLAMEHAVFEVEVEHLETGVSHGEDRIRFWFTPNPGMARRELREIASGGELSRVSLVLRASLLERPQKTKALKRLWPVLLFDELEQGLSVSAAMTVGQRLKELSAQFQIVLVTHSPALSALGDRHYVLYKKVVNGQTLTQARGLSDVSSRREEILRLMGAVSPAQREQLLPYVEDLLKNKVPKVKVAA